MIDVKESIYTRLAEDAQLATLAPGGVTYARPKQRPSAAPWITYFRIPGAKDPETDRRDDVYQVDVWSHSVASTDAAAERVIVLFDKQPLTPVTHRIAEVYLAGDFEDTEDESEPAIHHRALRFRVYVYPA